ncbi:MAG TPA: DUF1361 domain-containing protein [Armatimonadota bacterium]|jgi:uncharacterized membrane protein
MHIVQGPIWIVWNIFLALIPVALGYGVLAASKYDDRHPVASNIAVILIGFVWLIFMPNTCYLLTEWRHFLEMLGYTALHTRWTHDSNARLLLMTLTFFYMCYSGIGILTFALAIRPVAAVLRKHGVRLWLPAIPFFFLMSVGVYLGLMLRFNSWDLMTEFGAIVSSLSDLGERPMLTFYIFFFAAFLWVMYLATDIWIDGLMQRLKGK